jgi:two-component system LytT family response regulator
MTRFRALVADDEPLARDIVVGLLRADPDFESVIECGDAASAREQIASLRPDIAFLDIEMPGANGVQVADGLDARGPVVVFITAFSSYATQAFDVSAVDYVLKPFSDRRFAEAVERAKRRVRERRLGELATQVASLSAEMRHDDVAQPLAGAAPAYLQRLAFKAGDRAVVVKTADVIWIEAEDYYVRVHSNRGRHLVRTALATLEARLNPRDFLRVHRGAIVNVQKVAEVRDVGTLTLVLVDGAEVPVSRSKRAAVESSLLLHSATRGRLTDRGTMDH